ncbi:MAG: polysaccharide lyase beta-sandwich domain-containing protein [Bacteroidales bacterium]|nr:polysaccharide lyase beta-sandwich domain-containing protein [Bacteroidales bacterium]
MKRILMLAAYFLMLVPGVFASDPDMELLRKKIIAGLLTHDVHDAHVGTLLATIGEDGSWSGIDYGDVSRTAFQHVRHLDHLLRMSLAYRKNGSAFKGKKELKNAIHLALDFWLKNDFISKNWWHNEIGTPNDLTSVLLLMDNELTKPQIEKTLAITARAHINAWGARQSGDRIKIAGIQAKNALFLRNAVLFETLMKVIEGEIRFVPGNERGLQYDYSFHHRDDRVNNTLSYGLQYADVFAEWADMVAETRYRFSDAPLQLLIDYYLDGICKMMAFGKYPDPGATNRDITRNRHGHAAGAATPERLMRVTGYRKEELDGIARIRRNERKPNLSYGAFFWESEYYVHQRPQYFTSVRMFSSRNRNMEEPYNGEGLTNHHRGDGSNYLSLSGNEYFPLSPVYDWQKIPGTTVVQKPSLPSENEIQKPGVMDFAGAVTDGKYGAVGFDFISPHDPLKARKAWFFFDDEYVCLGADITSAGGYPAVTTLNQCLLAGDVSAGYDDKEQTMLQGEHKLNNTAWVYHSGTGYIFPKPVQVVLSNRQQSGSWYGINRQTASSRETVDMDVFKLWTDHGANASNAAYQYIVMPSCGKEQVIAASAQPKVDIVSNTADLQAVYHRELEMLQAVFYKTGVIDVAGDLRITADSHGIVMIRSNNGVIKTISVADPSRKLGKLHFTINRRIHPQAAHCSAVWNEAENVSEVSVELPQSPFAGKSVTINL